jgi:rRNA-processing protein EBP2
LIKPGLNTIGLAERKKKDFTNNVAGLKSKLEQFRLALPWIERLDLVNKPAPLAPELAYEEEMRKSSDDANVHDDFKRELLFYRQAQAAVLEALPRLKSMNVATKRPSDYFAQMAKSDEQMQKVCQVAQGQGFH